jgi:hypothetical protein
MGFSRQEYFSSAYHVLKIKSNFNSSLADLSQSRCSVNFKKKKNKKKKKQKKLPLPCFRGQKKFDNAGGMIVIRMTHREDKYSPW